MIFIITGTICLMYGDASQAPNKITSLVGKVPFSQQMHSLNRHNLCQLALPSPKQHMPI